MPKKVLKSFTKDVGYFAGGSLMLGAGAVAVAPFGAAYGGGLASAASLMPAVGTVMVMKPMVGMLGQATELLPKYKHPKRYRK